MRVGKMIHPKHDTMTRRRNNQEVLFMAWDREEMVVEGTQGGG